MTDEASSTGRTKGFDRREFLRSSYMWIGLGVGYVYGAGNSISTGDEVGAWLASARSNTTV